MSAAFAHLAAEQQTAEYWIMIAAILSPLAIVGLLILGSAVRVWWCRR